MIALLIASDKMTSSKIRQKNDPIALFKSDEAVGEAQHTARAALQTGNLVEHVEYRHVARPGVRVLFDLERIERSAWTSSPRAPVTRTTLHSKNQHSKSLPLPLQNVQI